MQKSVIKNLLFKAIIPCCLILIIFNFIVNIDYSQDKNAQQIKFYRNTETITPTINWIINWSDSPSKRKMIEDFKHNYEFKHQNIKINLGYTENKNKTKHAREIVRMIQNNLYEWEIVWIDESIYLQVSDFLNNPDWGNDYLVDFQKVEGFLLTQRPEIIQNESIKNKTGNIVPGPYLDGFYGVLWYNKIVASSLGIEVKERDMNFNDLMKYAQQVYEYNQLNDNKIALLCESKDFTTSILFQHLIWEELDQIKATLPVDSTVMKKDSATDYHYLKTVLDHFEDLSQYNPLIESNNVNMSYDAKRLFLDNKSLFMIGKTDLYNELQYIDEEKSKKILPAELPSFGHNKGYIGSFQPSFCVFKSASKRDAAVKLLKCLSTPSFAEKWSKKIKNPTGINVNIKENYLEDDPYNKFLIYIAKKYHYNVRYSIDASYLLGKQYGYLYIIVDDNLRLLLTNQINSKEAFNNIISNISE